MSRQYKRKYSLTIDDNSGSIRIIENLRIRFEITKSLISHPNIAKIEIFNANQDTLSALQKKFTKITFNAGYEGSVRLLFKGEIRNSFQERKGVDSITVIYAGDGERDWQNATFNKTMSENVSIKTVVDEIAKSFSGLTSGDFSSIDKVADKLRGQSLSGSSKDILDQLGEDYGFQWSIQDGELVTVPNDELITGTDAVLITGNTGMLGAPTITEVGADVETLLNPELTPNRSFKIESLTGQVSLGNLFFREVKKTKAEGIYKVQEVVHKGDTHDSLWSSSVKGRTTNVG